MMLIAHHHFSHIIQHLHVIVVILILVLPSMYPIIGCSERGAVACDTTQASAFL
jgi:hypothetical protein